MQFTSAITFICWYWNILLRFILFSSLLFAKWDGRRNDWLLVERLGFDFRRNNSFLSFTTTPASSSLNSLPFRQACSALDVYLITLINLTQTVGLP
jgi:hypothetical protein